jgi:polysaccharide export outer membrane protein
MPRSGPDQHVVQSEAAAVVAPERAAAPLAYALVDLSGAVISAVPPEEPGSIFKSFGGGRGPAPDIRVSVGDTLQTTIFEAVSGGLFIPKDAGTRPGNYVTLPPQVIERSGTLTVPYAGQIPVVGRTLQEIQNDIISRLSNRAIEPQAIVSFVDRSTEVAVVGDLNAPAKLKVNFNGDRILDMVSRAGGLKYAGHETFVTLQRRGKKATVYFNRLVQNPAENIYVAPGDTIYAYREQRFFTAFGASGEQGRFDFDTENLTLADAVGKSGGLLDSRAEPASVFLYRIEDRKLLEKVGVSLANFPPDQKLIPTIYRVNLRQGQGLFLTQQFPMRDRDILYISNADQVELNKFLDLVNNVSTTVSGVSNDALVTRNSIRALRR